MSKQRFSFSICDDEREPSSSSPRWATCEDLQTREGGPLFAWSLSGVIGLTSATGDTLSRGFGKKTPNHSTNEVE